MNYAEEIRRQAEAAPRAALPAVTAALWRAYSEGKITEAEAESLSAMVEIRLTAVTERAGPAQNGCGQDANTHQLRQNSPRKAVGSRPRTDASTERRRRWAASGRLPPGLAARFTLAEQAVLALVAAEVARRKDCRLSIENMAAIAGVCRSTVKNAIREAQRLGLLTVEERQVTGWRNDTNIVGIVSREWTAWLRLARRTLPPGGGVKSVTTTPTQVLESGKTRAVDPSRGRSASPNPTPRAASQTAGA
ncbi:helix-turn-helix domain-containing protein [Methylobacterium fujisawaense]|uniref:helix-turn-helix domain-containing protein n=1 Tax=Methylobacterium fujisawaense TaxID=107400 RepID=UPI00313CD96F